MNYALIRVYAKYKKAAGEELEVRKYAAKNKIQIDKIVYDDSLPRAELKDRTVLLRFLEEMEPNGTIFVTTLSTLGWRVGELVQIIDMIFKKKCTLVCLDEQVRVSPDMPACELISKLSQMRDKNINLGRSKLGRPKGSLSKSKYDKYLPQIVEFLKTSRNISALARELGISRTSLKDYIISRGL